MLRRLFSREICGHCCWRLILILLIIVTADSSPLWIYQGFR